MDSDLKLKRWYNHFNRKFFGGELPYSVSVFWQPCADASALTTPLDEDDVCITVDPCLMGLGKHAKLDLLHEMVHMKLRRDGFRGWRRDGKRFDDEIARLCGLREYRKLL